MTENTAPQINGLMESSVSYPYSLNPDPAKNLNPYPVPDLEPSYFLTLSEEEKNYFMIIRFSHQKKSIKR